MTKRLLPKKAARPTSDSSTQTMSIANAASDQTTAAGNAISPLHDGNINSNAASTSDPYDDLDSELTQFPVFTPRSSSDETPQSGPSSDEASQKGVNSDTGNVGAANDGQSRPFNTRVRDIIDGLARNFAWE
jgi:hypothetical protein